MRLRMAILLPALLAPAALLPVVSAPAAVDFRFAPPEWQTAICLPDDPHKSLVDRGGELLYHYGQARALRWYSAMADLGTARVESSKAQWAFDSRVPIRALQGMRGGCWSGCDWTGRGRA